MPDIGPLHPQIVHFVIALGVVGVLFRVLSLFLRPGWLGPAATTLILLTAVASVGAAKSGDDAHGPAERIPGARDAVHEHEEWGERTRNILLGLAGLELLTLGFGSRRAGRTLRYLAAAGGVTAIYAIVKTSELGGDVVYRYGGGIGTRSGNPDDIGNLLVAGLYHAAQVARDSGRSEVAARLTDELLHTRPADTAVRLLAAESRLKDRSDPAGALALLDGLALPKGHRLEARQGLLRAAALAATGRADSARAVLTALQQRYPENRAIPEALAQLP